MTSAVRKSQYGYSDGYIDPALERELRDREFRHAGEARPTAKPKVQVRSQVQVRQKQKVSVVAFMGFAAVTILALLTLLSYVQLTVLSGQMVEQQKLLATLDSEHMRLQEQYEEIYNDNAVKAAAEAAGMRKPGSGQIYYIDLSGGDSAEVFDPSEPGLADSLFTTVRDGLSSVAEYFG